jgi:hypothetical protein
MSMDDRVNDKVWLQNAYTTKSLHHIANELGVHRNTVRNRMLQFGIARRSRAEHFRNQPKSVSQRAKMSDAKKLHWKENPITNEQRLKISLARRKNGRTTSPYKYSFTAQDGYEAEHRRVASKSIGRSLVSGEVVHHIDGDPTNNAKENLEVITQSEHARIHAKSRKRNSKGQFASD